MPPDVRFKGYNAPKSISVGGLPKTSLGELTALSQTPLLDLRGHTSKEKGGVQGRGGMRVSIGRERERGEGRKREGEEEKGEGKKEAGMEYWPYQS